VVEVIQNKWTCRPFVVANVISCRVIQDNLLKPGIPSRAGGPAGSTLNPQLFYGIIL
jgi:hypothetical protein